jgi:guanine deaminase
MDEHGGAEFMTAAVRLAADNVDEGGGPFGAVVVKDGRIIARGRNQVTQECDPTAHAEVQAIRAACRHLGTFQLTDCEIYCSTEPCPMCLGAIYWARPRAVFFATDHTEAAAAGFDDQFIYEEIRRPVEERRLFTRRFEVDGRLEAFRRWEEKGDRVDY